MVEKGHKEDLQQALDPGTRPSASLFSQLMAQILANLSLNLYG